MYVQRCIKCSKEYPPDEVRYTCECGGLLEISYELSEVDTSFVDSNAPPSVWKYASLLPIGISPVTLKEGGTPLYECDSLSEELGVDMMVKHEGMNPTGSFKDRGSTILISSIKDFVKKDMFIAEDSSGNAGASIAAYAAYAGIKARIYVPESVSGQKFEQIKIYGAEVIKVRGGRTKVAEEAMKPEPGKLYIGHIYHPVFRDGMRTVAYELYEQLGGRAPSIVFLPVSTGTLLLGVIDGFKHLVDSNVIDEMPLIVACQTKSVSPLYHRLKGLKYSPPDRIETVADALVSTNPPLLDLMVKKMREVGGDSVVVEEDEILEAYWELASRGIFVETSSAVAYAAYKKYETDLKGPKVVILTGFGLKTRIYQRNQRYSNPL